MQALPLLINHELAAHIHSKRQGEERVDVSDTCRSSIQMLVYHHVVLLAVSSAVTSECRDTASELLALGCLPLGLGGLGTATATVSCESSKVRGVTIVPASGVDLLLSSSVSMEEVHAAITSVGGREEPSTSSGGGEGCGLSSTTRPLRFLALHTSALLQWEALLVQKPLLILRSGGTTVQVLDDDPALPLPRGTHGFLTVEGRQPLTPASQRGGSDDDGEEISLCLIDGLTSLSDLAKEAQERYQRKELPRSWFWPSFSPLPLHLPYGGQESDLPKDLRCLTRRLGTRVPSAVLEGSYLEHPGLNPVEWFCTPQRIVTPSPGGSRWSNDLLVLSIHTQLKSTCSEASSSASVLQGDYEYWHYLVDGYNDRGWGCAYRSLQTVLSWMKHQQYLSPMVNSLLPSSPSTGALRGGRQQEVVLPTLREIQKILVEVDDTKPAATFVGSSDWIGSYEVMMVLQYYLPSLECRMLRVERGSELETSSRIAEVLGAHFSKGGPPVMIGGSTYAHTIIGITTTKSSSVPVVQSSSGGGGGGPAETQREKGEEALKNTLLILDPHYLSSAKDHRTDCALAIRKGWVGWKVPSTFFQEDQWYNLCIPLLYDE